MGIQDPLDDGRFDMAFVDFAFLLLKYLLIVLDKNQLLIVEEVSDY
jgi:hypothetical protein